MLTEEQMDSIACYDIRDGLQRAYRMGLADAAKIVKENIGFYGERSQRAALYALSILEMQIVAESVSESLRAEAGE